MRLRVAHFERENSMFCHKGKVSRNEMSGSRSNEGEKKDC